MASDLNAIVRELGAFHELRDRTVLVVGAGGGQLVEYVFPARRVIAVDRDRAALDRLKARLDALGRASAFELVESDFCAVDSPADVVVFEFSLHETGDPAAALDHASGLAREVLVFEHAPGSRWIWYAAEDHLVDAAWRAVLARPVVRRREAQVDARFASRKELEEKLAGQGPVSRERIAALPGQGEIVLPMPYWLALL